MLAAVSGGCASTSSGLDPAATAVTVADRLPPPSAADSVPGRDFRLGPNDQIVVEVFGVEELKREGRIDGAGNFSFPLVGSVQAAGRTPAELASSIEDRLRGRFIRDPQVSVNITELVSQSVAVDGQVTQPGRYVVIGEMTLQEAIASARGLTAEARITEVVVFRTVAGQRMAALFSLKDIREGRYADPDIYAGDVVVVGTSRARQLFRELAQIAPIFSVFTPLVYSINNSP